MEQIKKKNTGKAPVCRKPRIFQRFMLPSLAIFTLLSSYAIGQQRLQNFSKHKDPDAYYLMHESPVIYDNGKIKVTLQIDKQLQDKIVEKIGTELFEEKKEIIKQLIPDFIEAAKSLGYEPLAGELKMLFVTGNEIISPGAAAEYYRGSNKVHINMLSKNLHNVDNPNVFQPRNNMTNFSWLLIHELAHWVTYQGKIQESPGKTACWLCEGANQILTYEIAKNLFNKGKLPGYENVTEFTPSMIYDSEKKSASFVGFAVGGQDSLIRLCAMGTAPIEMRFCEKYGIGKEEFKELIGNRQTMFWNVSSFVIERESPDLMAAFINGNNMLRQDEKQELITKNSLFLDSNVLAELENMKKLASSLDNKKIKKMLEQLKTGEVNEEIYKTMSLFGYWLALKVGIPEDRPLELLSFSCNTTFLPNNLTSEGFKPPLYLQAYLGKLQAIVETFGLTYDGGALYFSK